MVWGEADCMQSDAAAALSTACEMVLAILVYSIFWLPAPCSDAKSACSLGRLYSACNSTTAQKLARKAKQC